MRQSFVAQLIQLLKLMCGVLYDVWWGVVVGRIGPFLLTKAGWRHSSFWCRLLNLLSILLRCNGFSRIKKAVVH